MLYRGAVGPRQAEGDLVNICRDVATKASPDPMPRSALRRLSRPVPKAPAPLTEQP